MIRFPSGSPGNFLLCNHRLTYGERLKTSKRFEAANILDIIIGEVQLLYLCEIEADFFATDGEKGLNFISEVRLLHVYDADLLLCEIFKI